MRPQRIELELLEDEQGYLRGLLPALRQAKRELWIATSNVKDVWVETDGWHSITESLSTLAGRGVDVRILHSSTPSRRFRDRLMPHNAEHGEVKMRCCVRLHMKCVLVDGAQLYMGSANLTGAGIGAKGENRRNFEYGILTRDLQLVHAAHRKFSRIWQGDYCRECGREDNCPSVL